MRMNTLTMSREAVSPSPRRTEAKTDRKRSKGPEIRRTGNLPQVTLKQIRCQRYKRSQKPEWDRSLSGLLASGFGLLASGFWLLASGFWLPRLLYPQLEVQPYLQLELPCILEIRRIRNRSAFRRYQAERIGAIDVQNAAAHQR